MWQNQNSFLVVVGVCHDLQELTEKKIVSNQNHWASLAVRVAAWKRKMVLWSAFFPEGFCNRWVFRRDLTEVGVQEGLDGLEGWHYGASLEFDCRQKCIDLCKVGDLSVFSSNCWSQ